MQALELLLSLFQASFKSDHPEHAISGLSAVESRRGLITALEIAVLCVIAPGSSCGSTHAMTDLSSAAFSKLIFGAEVMAVLAGLASGHAIRRRSGRGV